MDTPELLSEVNETIEVYEQVLGSSAARTRRMIENHGAVEALSRLVQSPDLQAGFKVLRDRGRLDRTFEAVIVRHPTLFHSRVVAAAQWRLDNAENLL